MTEDVLKKCTSTSEAVSPDFSREIPALNLIVKITKRDRSDWYPVFIPIFYH